jgi:hypothetical protein
MSSGGQAGTAYLPADRRACVIRSDEVVENIERVTRHIAETFVRDGVSGWSRRTLTVVLPATERRGFEMSAAVGGGHTFLLSGRILWKRRGLSLAPVV